MALRDPAGEFKPRNRDTAMASKAQPRVTAVGGRAGADGHGSAGLAGEAAGLAKAGVHTCPYQHPAFRSSWLKGYAQAQQQSFDF